MPGMVTRATVDDIKQAERNLIQELRQRAMDQISGVNSSGDVHIRDILPSEDLDADDTNNVNTWNGTTREWQQSGLSANSNNQVYEIDASNKMEGKIIGIFAISSTAADVITTEMTFEDGTGSVFERLNVQKVETFTEGEIALMRNPVIYNEGKDGVIYQYTDVAGTDRLVYHGAVAEKAGTTLGTRSNSEQAPSGRARQVA